MLKVTFGTGTIRATFDNEKVKGGWEMSIDKEGCTSMAVRRFLDDVEREVEEMTGERKYPFNVAKLMGDVKCDGACVNVPLGEAEVRSRLEALERDVRELQGAFLSMHTPGANNLSTYLESFRDKYYCQPEGKGVKALIPDGPNVQERYTRNRGVREEMAEKMPEAGDKWRH